MEKNNVIFDELPALLRNVGYIINVDEFDMNYFCGRDNEILKMQVILNKKIKNNILLVGNPGVGKTKIVEAYAAKNNVKNIYVVECAKLVGGCEFRGTFEQKVVDVLDYAKKYNLILFFDEMHSLINLGNSMGGMSITNILKPYLLDKEYCFIGATTLEEAKYFVEDEAFKRRFSILRLDEPSYDTLKNIKNNFENNVLGEQIIDDIHMNKILDDLNDKLPDKYFPDKLLDLLDYVYSYITITDYKNSIEDLIGEYINEQREIFN